MSIPMEDERIVLTEEDFREALREIGTYIDITENDLKRLFEIATRISRARCANTWLAKEIMTYSVVTAHPDMDLHEAGRLLLKNRVSGMPVVDVNNRVLGVISTADLLTMAGIPQGHVFNDVVMKYILHKPTPQHRTSGKKVKDIMTSPAITVHPYTSVREIAIILDKKRIKRVPVVEEDGRLAGIVSRADIVRVVCEDQGSEGTEKDTQD